MAIEFEKQSPLSLYVFFLKFPTQNKLELVFAYTLDAAFAKLKELHTESFEIVLHGNVIVQDLIKYVEEQYSNSHIELNGDVIINGEKAIIREPEEKPLTETEKKDKWIQGLSLLSAEFLTDEEDKKILKKIIKKQKLNEYH